MGRVGPQVKAWPQNYFPGAGAARSYPVFITVSLYFKYIHNSYCYVFSDLYIPTGLIPRTLGPSNVFILLNG